MIEGTSHLTFIVKDLESAAEFFTLSERLTRYPR